MARQIVYPDYYPEHAARSSHASAWDFLLGNQTKATEACILWLLNEFNRTENVNMAKNAAKRDSGKTTERADWKGYANIDLSPDDKQAVKGGILDGESVLDILAEIIGTGHKISLTHDREKDTITCAVTGVYSNCRNAGYTLTSFARTLGDALTVTAYKHEIVAKGDWSKFVRGTRQTDDIG